RADPVSGPPGASDDPPRATTRSAAWPSSNEHQPTQNPGRRASSASNAWPPDATTTSAGATPTPVERPRRTAAAPVPGGRLLISPDATRSACCTGPLYEPGSPAFRAVPAVPDPEPGPRP